MVTGASGGMGAAIASHLAAAGAKVAIGARRESRLQELKTKLESQGLTIRYTVCDVTQVNQVMHVMSYCICDMS